MIALRNAGGDTQFEQSKHASQQAVLVVQPVDLNHILYNYIGLKQNAHILLENYGPEYTRGKQKRTVEVQHQR